MSHQSHILIADDERSIRLMLETGLTLNGFRVTSARNGREALEAVSSGQFDAVLSDVFTVQSSIATQVAAALDVVTTPWAVLVNNDALPEPDFLEGGLRQLLDKVLPAHRALPSRGPSAWTPCTNSVTTFCQR